MVLYSCARKQHINNPPNGGDNMSEEKKNELLGEIREALECIPEGFQADVARSITYDIGVMAKTISIAKAAANNKGD